MFGRVLKFCVVAILVAVGLGLLTWRPSVPTVTVKLASPAGVTAPVALLITQETTRPGQSASDRRVLFCRSQGDKCVVEALAWRISWPTYKRTALEISRFDREKSAASVVSFEGYLPPKQVDVVCEFSEAKPPTCRIERRTY